MELQNIVENYGILGVFVVYIIQQNFFLVKKLTKIIESNTEAITELKTTIDSKNKNGN